VKYVRVERPAGRFMRKFNLPGHLNLDAISASCQQGVLTVVVPKMPAPEPHKPRTFEVPVGTVPSSVPSSSSS
jgi:HSP20 family protein